MTTSATAAPAAPQVGAAAVLAALQGHYRRPGEARDGEILIPEVQAPGATRRADLVRVGMWASRGVGIDVHEIKVSRADWRRELDDPAKAEAWWPYCNRFWVVAPPGVIPEGELPAGWGLMVLPASGRRLRVRVRAATRTDIQLTVPLMVELLRRADNQRLAEIDAIREQHRTEVRELDATWRAQSARDGLPWELQERLELLDQFEQALGIRLARIAGRPRDSPQQVTPGELAVCAADARARITVQRRAADLAWQEDRIRRAAEAVLESLPAAKPSDQSA